MFLDTFFETRGLCLRKHHLYSANILIQRILCALWIRRNVFHLQLVCTIFCRLFYYFFESRNSKDDPVVIWLTGGPGCSSAIALFYENGPFHITKNMSLSWNSFGWDKVLVSIFYVLLNILQFSSRSLVFSCIQGFKHNICRPACWDWF